MVINTITKEQRQKIEELVYKVYDAADTTHINSDYYKELFSKMSDKEFLEFCKRRLPFRFHQQVFKIEPKMTDIFNAFKILNKPLLEKINLPHVYKNNKGEAIKTQEALVIFLHLKRMKQMLSKKNHVSMDTEKRDMKTGLLSHGDKAAGETDREFEALAAYGLDYTIDEFRTVKADALRAGQEMMATILDKGTVSEKDYVVAKDDSPARNMMNVYLLGANIYSNLIDTDYMTPYTAKMKQKKVERE